MSLRAWVLTHPLAKQSPPRREGRLLRRKKRSSQRHDLREGGLLRRPSGLLAKTLKGVFASAGAFFLAPAEAISSPARGGIASSAWRPARKDIPSLMSLRAQRSNLLPGGWGDCFVGLAASSQRHTRRGGIASSAWRPPRKDMTCGRGDCFVAKKTLLAKTVLLQSISETVPQV